MAGKLKIYACSGIGDAERYNYWKDNVNVLKNTQAVNTLMAYIDTNYTELHELRLSKEQRLQLLNEIDFYAVCLSAAQDYSDNKSELERVGRVIGSFYKDGAFDFDSTEDGRRDAHLDELYKVVGEAMANGKRDNYKNKQFASWWNKTIVERDKVGMTDDQRELFEHYLAQAAASVKGVGEVDESWQNDENIAKYLDKAGNYFLYTFFTKKQLAQLPQVFTTKALYQLQTYYACTSYFVTVYGSEDDMREIIRTQIMREYHQTPEKLCKWIVSHPDKSGAIGFAWETFASVVTAIAALIVPVIVAAFQYSQTVDAARYQSLNEQVIKDNVPQESDYSRLDMNKTKTDWSDLAMYGALGLGALLLFKK